MNTLKLHNLIIILGLWGSANAQTMPSPYSIRTYSIKEGLSQGTVYAITQDSRGFLWFGTQYGLNRFDGRHFTPYQHVPGDSVSLVHNVVHTLLVDSRNRLWTGTSAGLQRYRRKKDLFTPPLLKAAIISLCESHEGHLWVGTHGQGLFRADSVQVVPAAMPGLENNYIQALIEDRRHQLWVGTEEGLFVLKAGAKRFERIQMPAVQPVMHQILFLVEDGGGTLWCGTEAGLMRWDVHDDAMIPVRLQIAGAGSDERFPVINRLLQDDYGHYWLGGHHEGLYQWDGYSRFVRPVSLPGIEGQLNRSRILSLFQDRSNVVWAGTAQVGAMHCTPNPKAVFLYQHNPDQPNSLGHNTVRGFCEDRDGLLWIATDGGLSRWDRAQNHFDHYRHIPGESHSLSSNYVWTVFEDTLGVLWCGTREGLNRINRQHGRISFTPFIRQPLHESEHPENNYGSLEEDAWGHLWISSWGDGLLRFNKTTGEFTPFHHDPQNKNTPSTNTLFMVVKSRKNPHVFWVGTDGHGLDKIIFDEQSQWPHRVEHFRHDPEDVNSLGGNRVRVLHEDSQGRLWIGLAGGGLCCLEEEDGRFRRFGLNDGLPDEVIYGIEEDAAGHLWISSNKGLSRYDAETHAFRNLTTADGLQGHEFSGAASVRLSDNSLLFGGVRGFNRIIPDRIVENNTPPQPVLTRLFLHHQAVTWTPGNPVLKTPVWELEALRLKHHQNALAFEFTALHYTAPEANHFAYRMEGLDKSWHYSGNYGYASYDHLPPGHYQFQVKAANRDGIWSPNPLILTVHIAPPFWRKPGFFLIVICGIAALLRLLFIRFKIKRMAQQQEVQARLKEKTEAAERLQCALDKVETLQKRLEAENIYLRTEIQQSHNFTHIVGESDALKRVLTQVEQVAPTESTVLILGDSGTGKELIARAIHDLSPRQDRPLVKVDCTALPATLIESTLFGHERGAFTGALARRVGRFELAHGSTLFLDEIGDMDLGLQAKLLRVLQDGAFERVGGTKTLHMDVRVIAATHRDLVQAIKEGRFRQDLYYRLNVFPITMPPLRMREGDVTLLAHYFIKKFCTKLGKPLPSVSQSIMTALESYAWPGNVRELENVIERAVILSPADRLVLDKSFLEQERRNSRLFPSMEAMEKKHIEEALKRVGGKVSGPGGAAELLGMRPTTLDSRMKKLQIIRPSK